MDDLVLLFLLSLAMLVCSFLAGILPLLVNMSEEKLQFMTALGAGLLIGAALVVIIPEGVEAVYSRRHTAESAGDHRLHDRSFKEPSLAEPPAPHAAEVKSLTVDAAHPQHPPAPSKNTENVEDVAKKLDISNKDKDDDGEREKKHEKEAGSGVGAALVTGFVFMLLVDQLSSKLSGGVQRNKVTATLGLVVHAAADGIALGASAMTKHLDMEMLVFFAIMLHKAPTAFGLVTFLLHEGMDKVRIRRHLIIFSLAAPIGALLTYFLIQMGSEGVAPSDRTSGLVLLFSGGTFLYVAAVHVLPEISHHVPHASVSGTNSYTPVPNHATDLEKSVSVIGAGDRGGKLRPLHLLAIVTGAFLPLFLTLNHSH